MLTIELSGASSAAVAIWLLSALLAVASQATGQTFGPPPHAAEPFRRPEHLVGRSTQPYHRQEEFSPIFQDADTGRRGGGGHAGYATMKLEAQPERQWMEGAAPPESPEPSASVSRGLFQKIELKGPLGRCLDGTLPVYYFAPGAQSRKWVVFFEGGDWCTRFHSTGQRDAARNCAQRALLTGTSRGKRPYKIIAPIGKLHNQLSEDPSENPMMHDWNKLYVQNCDATSFTSSLLEAKEVAGSRPLYFRGKYIMDELITDALENRNLGNATDLVVSGCSAGGLTVYLHADRWQQRLMAYAQDRLGRTDADRIRVVGLADSGFFLARASECPGEQNFMARMRFLHDELNASAALLPSCTASHPPAQAFRCLYAQNILQHTQVPIFTLQSAMDGWQLEWVACNATRSSRRGRLHAELLIDTVSQAVHADMVPHGAFVDGCQHHCHCFHRIQIEGTSQAQAFQRYYEGEEPARRVWHDLACHAELDEPHAAECPWKPLSWQRTS